MKNQSVKILRLLLAIMLILSVYPVSVRAVESDFTIEDGVLTKYNGGGDVLIPDSVTSIGDYAFSFCPSLTSVTIPDSVTRIGEGAFCSCTSLTNANIPNSVITIGNSAFSGCSSLMRVIIPSSVTVIGNDAFSGCSSLASVTIPRGVTSIGIGAFAYCTTLTAIQVDAGNPSYRSTDGVLFSKDMRMLVACPGGVNENYIVPNGVTSIEDDAFRGCSNLTNVTIPSSVTKIGKSAFYGTPFLRNMGEFVVVNGRLLEYQGYGGSVSIPADVISIGERAFNRCHSLTSVNIPDSVTSIGDDVFYGCSSLTSVIIPDSVTSIGSGAFYGCTNLTDVTILPGATQIGDWAFEGTPWLENLGEFAVVDGILLKYQGEGGDVVIPEGVASICGRAFLMTSSISSLTLPDSLESFTADSFFGLGTDVKFIVSDKVMISAYTEWKNNWKNPDVVCSEDDAIIAVANQIVIDAGAITDYEKAKAICYWIANNIKYNAEEAIGQGHGGSVSEYAEENCGPMSTDPNIILTVPGTTTICDGYSRVVNALLSAVGIPSRYISSASLDHAWNEVFVDGRWIIVDTTWMAPISELNGVWGQYGLDDDWFGVETPYDMINPQGRSHVTLRYIAGISYDRKTDIPSDWAKDEILAGFTAKIIPYDMTSNYQAEITRQEFCRLMMVLVEQYLGYRAEIPTETPFIDTSDENVLAAYKLGIVNGTSPNTFNPTGSITRQEAAVMLARTAKLLGLTAHRGEGFTDSNQMADWAKDSVMFVSGLTDSISGNKVMGGTGNGNFSPLSTYTREQAYLTVLRLSHCA